MTRAIAWIAVLAFGAPALAEVPKNAPPQKDSLQAVLDRIQTHAEEGGWRRDGWKDEAIEAWLDKLVGQVAAAAERPQLKLPVRHADVKPINAAPRVITGALIVGKDIHCTGNLRHSVLLADGSVRIDGVAEGCVIVARSTISISNFSKSSVMVAGISISVAGFDGAPGGTGEGSLMVTRGWVETGSSSYGSIVAALEGVSMSRLQDTLLINRDVPEAPNGLPVTAKRLQIPAFPLEPLPDHPLNAKIKVLSLIQLPPTPPAVVAPGGFAAPAFAAAGGRSTRISLAGGMVFRFAGRRLVADVGEPIVDEAGNPVEGLQNWKLSFANDRFAVLTTGATDAIIRTESK
jgi:hypothetical protein